MTSTISPRHRTLIYGPDSTYRLMGEAWFQSELVAPGTWRILSDGDYIYLIEGDSAGPEAPASAYARMSYVGVTIMYLKDKVQ